MGLPDSFAELSPYKLILCSHGPMKSMKKSMKSCVMTAPAAYSSVAETIGLKAKEVKAVVEGLVEVAAGELKKNGNFKLAGALNLKLKKKPAQAARKGVNPFTKEPCVFKAKPASKTVRAFSDEKAEGDDQLSVATLPCPAPA